MIAVSIDSEGSRQLLVRYASRSPWHADSTREKVYCKLHLRFMHIAPIPNYMCFISELKPS